MGIGAQAQEVKQVVQIHLPIPLRVDVGGQVHPRQLAREALLALIGNHRLVMVIGAMRVLAQPVEHTGRFLRAKHVAPALVVLRRLRGEVFGARDVELPVEDRVAGGVFVDVGGAVFMSRRTPKRRNK